MKKMAVLALISYRVLPALMGGQKWEKMSLRKSPKNFGIH